MAVDGIVAAQYLITQLGTPYSKRDCINAVVTDVIRKCKGGNILYRIGGCTALWESADASSKYRDVTRRMTLAEAKAEGMLIGDLPVIYDEKSGVCEHIAFYMGGIGGYECLHSSATKGELCATTLKNGFTHVLRHRYITGRLPSDVGGAAVEANGVTQMNVLYYARVTTEGGSLNLRSAPKKQSGNVICGIPNGTQIAVLENTDAGWTYVSYGDVQGYVSNQYLTRVSVQVPDVSGSPVVSIPNISADDLMSGITVNGSWGLFIPCSSMEDAETLHRLLSSAYTIRHEVSD